MRNITDILARYLSDINLPSVSIIDIIEIILITFFVYQFMVWIKYTHAYTLLKGNRPYHKFQAVHFRLVSPDFPPG